MKYNPENEDEQHKLHSKIIELRETIVEEFDILELVEDSIRSIFQCDLNCVTCSNLERAKCMQHFKVANLLWLRKISQDEWMLQKIVVEMDKMADALDKMHKNLSKYDHLLKGGKQIEETFDEEDVVCEVCQEDQAIDNREELQEMQRNLHKKDPENYKGYFS